MVGVLGWEIFRYGRASGQEVVVGLSWDVLLLFTAFAFFVFLVHFVVRDVANPVDHTVTEDEPTKDEVVESLREQGVEEVERFTATQRASHWIMAVSVFVLMLSGFLMMNPDVTIRAFVGVSWLDLHVLFSLVLIGYVVFHVGHVAYKGTWKAMWIGRREVEDLIVRGKNLVGVVDEYPRQFEYPSAQKFLHLGVTVSTLAIVGTGLVILRRVDVPVLWDATREFSVLGVHFSHATGEPGWGLVTWSFVFHDLFAILLVGLVLGHVYFAIRPDEWGITRSMVTGHVTVDTYAEKYSPNSWTVGGVKQTDGGETADRTDDVE